MAGFNFAAAIIGPPEYGKTTIMRMLLRRHLEDANAIAIVCDPLRQFGTRTFKDPAELRKAFIAGAAMPRLLSVENDAEGVTALAYEVGRKWNKATHVTRPILLCYDEAALMEGSGATWMGRQDRVALATRRHAGVGLVYNLQRANQMTKGFFDSCTDIYLLFQLPYMCQIIEQSMALRPGTLEAAGVDKLKIHEYLHVRHIVGVVQEEL